MVTIDSGSGLSGSLQATLRNVNDGREISMSGTFRELRVQEGTPESCGMASAGSPVRRLP
jgi:hypothetical protein